MAQTFRPAGPPRRRRRFEYGATATEYALMVGFIAVVIVIAVAAIGTNLSAFFQDASTKI